VGLVVDGGGIVVGRRTRYSVDMMMCPEVLYVLVAVEVG
jgi:hypothetical protein